MHPVLAKYKAAILWYTAAVVAFAWLMLSWLNMPCNSFSFFIAVSVLLYTAHRAVLILSPVLSFYDDEEEDNDDDDDDDDNPTTDKEICVKPLETYFRHYSRKELEAIAMSGGLYVLDIENGEIKKVSGIHQFNTLFASLPTEKVPGTTKNKKQIQFKMTPLSGRILILENQ